MEGRTAMVPRAVPMRSLVLAYWMPPMHGAAEQFGGMFFRLVGHR